MKKRIFGTLNPFQLALIWFHGAITGFYLWGREVNSFSDRLWNLWWIFIWSLCLVGVYYLLKDKFTNENLDSGSDVHMPEADLSRFQEKDDK